LAQQRNKATEMPAGVFRVGLPRTDLTIGGVPSASAATGARTEPFAERYIETPEQPCRMEQV
jgi:hypothetical protein